MSRKEKILSRLVAGVSVAAMVFAIVPFQLVNAAERGSEIMEVVGSYMDGRENAVMSGNVDNLEDVSVIGIVNDEVAHRQELIEKNIIVSDMSYKILAVDTFDTMATVALTESVVFLNGDITESDEIEHNLTIMYDEHGAAKVVSDEYAENLTRFQSCSYIAEEPESVEGPQ